MGRNHTCAFLLNVVDFLICLLHNRFYMKPILLSLFCLTLVFSAAQVNTTIESADGQTFNISTRQFVLSANANVPLMPSVMLMGAEKVYAGVTLQEDFVAYLDELEYLWQFRYLRKTAEAYSTLDANQSLEPTMFKFNK